MKIKKICKNLESKFTVDIEVENTHSYQLENGIVTHNTSSLILGTSSGIHGRHAPFYIRRIRYDKNEPIAIYLQKFHPEIIEQDVFSSNAIVVSIPQKSPENSIFRNEDPIDFLERVKYFYQNWILNGHISGPNTHNVSCTVSLKNNEWEKVGNWMWENKENYAAISVLPYDGGSYAQPPFEDTTEEIYNNMLSKLKNIDITEVLEDGDYTDLQGELACAGGACEVNFG